MQHIVNICTTILVLVSEWVVFKKMGRRGWEGIIPFYNYYVLCKLLYGNGNKMFFILIPFYNIYFLIRMNIDQAKAFHRTAGFGVGMAFIPFVFETILAFSASQYGDGSQANTDADFVTTAANKAKELAKSVSKDPQALEKIEKLNELKEKGLISEEEYTAKKEDLLKKV